MPPMVGLALLGAGLYVAVRLIRREMARVGDMLDRTQARPQPIEIRLERDPRTGVYGDPRSTRR